MKTYLLKRIQTFAAYMTAVTFLIAVVGTVFQFKQIAVFLILLGIAPLFFSKGRWFLLAPYSRKYLLWLHAVETFFLTFISVFFTSLLYVLLVRDQNEGLSLTVVVVSSAILCFFRLGTPVSVGANQPIQQNPESNRTYWSARKGRLALILGAYILFVIMMRQVGRVEPIVWMVVVLYMISMFPMSAVSLLVMPREAYNKWRFSCICVGSVLSVGVILVTLFSIMSADPRGRMVVWSSFAIGRIPIPLSQERMLNLAMVPNGAELPQLLRLDETIKESVTESEWKTRTSRCFSSTCLDISDSLIPTSLSEDMKVDRFIEIMKLCYPEMKGGGYLRCGGARLSDAHLESWLKKLVEAKTIDKWLFDSDPRLQFIAIRTLASFTLDENQTKRIKDLQQSEDQWVRAAAHFHFTFYASEACAKPEQRCQKPQSLSELF